MDRPRRITSCSSRLARFTVNVSGQTLAHPQFSHFFAEMANAARVATASILFEIEETDLLERPREAAKFGSEIREAGGGIVVDGFGREAVSLAPLKALRPDYVKFDGTIIRRLCANDAAAGRVKAMLRICDSLRIGLIAECVEEPAVLARLEALGVRHAQGFGLSRPRPIEELARREQGYSSASGLSEVVG